MHVVVVVACACVSAHVHVCLSAVVAYRWFKVFVNIDYVIVRIRCLIGKELFAAELRYYRTLLRYFAICGDELEHLIKM